MRLPATVLTLLLLAGPALAQAPLTGTTGVPTTNGPVVPAPSAGTATPATPRPAHRRQTLQERFDAANATHDGHLTLEQARGKMPSVARDFDEIDATHKGYVTMDDIKAHAAARRAARRSAAHPAQ